MTASIVGDLALGLGVIIVIVGLMCAAVPKRTERVTRGPRSLP